MSTPSAIKIFTVSEISSEIKIFLEKRYRFIRIVGEVSNLKTSFSGHSYFTLKDNSAQLQAVIFKQQQRFIDSKITDGQKIICFGRISLYEPRGSYQLVVDSIEPAGEGQIRLEFEKTRKKLATQGYFADENKQKIPEFTEKIAIITSPTGAAIADFLKIIRLRKTGVHIQLYPVLVQGQNAPQEIAAAIKEIDQLQYHDVLVLIRGGGSLEDLQAFNDERVADAIFSAKLPIVTGIGHQIDFTIADFCADYRCPTPTAAAEYLATDSTALQRRLSILRSRLINKMQHKLESATQHLRYHNHNLKEITRKFTEIEHRLKLRHTRINVAMASKITATENQITYQRYRLERNSPLAKIETQGSTLAQLQKKLQQNMNQHICNYQKKFQKTTALLHSVSPLATLARGYSITRKKGRKENSVIRKADEISPGEQVEIQLHQGKIECEVKKTILIGRE